MNNGFPSWLENWTTDLPEHTLAQIARNPEKVALVSEDLLEGFCSQGALASPRATAILPAVTSLFEQAYKLGVRHFLLFQDTHSADAAEFAAFPPHCIAGTGESETVSQLAELGFSDHFTIFPKNSVSSTVGTDLIPWLDAHPEVTTFIVVGVCTDICIYQAAMALRARANSMDQHETRVIIPANCVQTYDLPVEVAKEIDALPHDGDLLHLVSLYHMALNGIEVVSQLN